MQIIKPKVMVPREQFGVDVLKKLERYARVCYKSENSSTAYDDGNFLKTLLKSGHESVIEHEKLTVLFVVDRGITHEIVRHRIASYSQESTRYCNYSKGKFGNEITVIEPFFLIGRPDDYDIWEKTCQAAEQGYLKMLAQNCSAQEARSVLPNSLKTELVMTMNMREWRHFFALRATINAHPQMKQVTIPLLKLFQEKLPPLFADVEYDPSFPEEHLAEVILTDEIFQG